MYYIEVMRTWRVFWRYLIVLAGLYLLTTFLYTILPHGVSQSERTAIYSAGGHAAIVAFVCLLFASVFGSSLSRHLDHLDFALTKPRARTAFVASVLGIDVLSLGVFFVATTIAVIGLHIAAGQAHGVVFDAASWFGIALAFGSVLAWYAIVQAVSCGRDAAGWALASVWVAALILHFLTALNLGPGLNALIAAFNLINPIAYLSIVPFLATTGPVPLSLVVHAVAIYFVAAAAALVALLRWQRIET